MPLMIWRTPSPNLSYLLLPDLHGFRERYNRTAEEGYSKFGELLAEEVFRRGLLDFPDG